MPIHYKLFNIRYFWEVSSNIYSIEYLVVLKDSHTNTILYQKGAFKI